MNMTNQFGYRCEYCVGTVRERRVEREAFKHKAGFVILEEVVIGVCDKCGNRYYSADTLKRVQAIASGKIRPTRTEQVPVATAR
jgi:YgiT-type zinc finger domain-containing protein